MKKIYSIIGLVFVSVMTSCDVFNFGVNSILNKYNIDTTYYETLPQNKGYYLPCG